MKIKWYGQACFLIESSSGLRIVTDPYTPETAGYKYVAESAQVVITSSDNDSFHCRADLISGNPDVVNALAVAQAGNDGVGLRSVHGLEIHAIEAMEALNHRFHDPDQNGMYKFSVDGISIGHMGDVGNAMSDKQTAFFKDIDVMLVLAGGHPTIELDALKTFLDAIQPKLIIPMHFRTLSYKPRNIFWIQNFLDYYDDKQVDLACSCETTLTKAQLPASTRVLVIDNVA
jgi:L-ascorbate metabolism protein UlaG (beta-lactamase superfamily)